MAQTKEGALKIAAAKIGIGFDEYKKKIASNQKWCTLCQRWHDRGRFATDNSRSDGLVPSCRESKNKRARDTHVAKPFISRRGRRFVKPRDGDKKQARARVNHLVFVGLLKNPNDIACLDCGHTGDDRRHEYDHHMGYDAEYHETVEAVCSACHSARHPVNRKRNKHGQYTGE